MEKEFIPYEQALALKELGFDEPCLGFYYKLNDDFLLEIPVLFYRENKNSIIDETFDNNSDCITAPTFSQAFRWFREKYNFDVVIQKKWRYSPNYNPKETFYTYYLFNFTLDRENGEYILEDTALAYETYEEAKLECLKKLIEIVKNK